MKKFLKILMLTLLGLVVLAAAAVPVVLFTPVRDKVINHFASPYVDGSIHTGRLRLGLGGRFTVKLFDVVLDDGRPIVAVDTLQLRISLGRLMARNVQADGEIHGLTVRRTDFLHLPPSDGQGGELSLPRMDVSLLVDGTSISYGGLLRNARINVFAEAHNSDSGFLEAKASVYTPHVTLRSPSDRLALDGLRLDVGVMRPDELSVAERRLEVRRRMRERMAAIPDSLRGRRPDFLSEKDFEKADIAVKVDSAISKFVREWNPRGKVSMRHAVLTSPKLPLKNSLEDFRASFDLDSLDLESLDLVLGTSNLRASGRLKGIRTLFMGRGKSFWNLKLDAQSDSLNLNEILHALNMGKDAPDSLAINYLDDDAYYEAVTTDSLANVSERPELPLIVVPANIVADARLEVSKARYADINISDFSADIASQQRCIRITDLKADTDLGNLALDAFYSTKTKQDICAGFNLDLQGVTPERARRIVPTLGESVPMINDIEGSLDCTLAATALLDTNMKVRLNTMDGIFKVESHGLALDQTPSIRRITRLLLFKDKNKIRVGKVNINGLVSGSRVEIFPFVINVDRYSLGLSGVQNFDNPYDYRLSLIRAPLLLFRFGVRLYGRDFNRVRWRLCASQFKSPDVPSFSPEVEKLQSSLVASIHGIFENQAESAIRQNRAARSVFSARKRAVDYQESLEELTDEEMAKIDQMTVDLDVEIEEEETRELVDDTVDRALKDLQI